MTTASRSLRYSAMGARSRAACTDQLHHYSGPDRLPLYCSADREWPLWLVVLWRLRVCDNNDPRCNEKFQSPHLRGLARLTTAFVVADWLFTASAECYIWPSDLKVFEAKLHEIAARGPQSHRRADATREVGTESSGIAGTRTNCAGRS